MDLWNWQQQVQIYQSFVISFHFSYSLCWEIAVSPPLMFSCPCLPQTPFGTVWLLSFVMCWMFTKLSNQYYVATYLIEQISQFWWSCDVRSLWWINMWRDCQPESVYSMCVSNSLCWAQRSQENTWRERQKLIYDHIYLSIYLSIAYVLQKYISELAKKDYFCAAVVS